MGKSQSKYNVTSTRGTARGRMRWTMRFGSQGSQHASVTTPTVTHTGFQGPQYASGTAPTVTQYGSQGPQYASRTTPTVTQSGSLGQPHASVTTPTQSGSQGMQQASVTTPTVTQYGSQQASAMTPTVTQSGSQSPQYASGTTPTVTQSGSQDPQYVSGTTPTVTQSGSQGTQYANVTTPTMTQSGSQGIQQHCVTTLTVTASGYQGPQHGSGSGNQATSTSTLQLTPENENYWRLVKILLDDVPSKLRALFRSAFQEKYRVAWVEHSASGKMFLAMVPNSQKGDKHIRDTVERGVTDEFDCTILFYCLLFSGTDLLTPVVRKKERRVSPFHHSERVDQLREQRNALAHATTPRLPEAQFRARIRDIEDVYTELQWDQTELKKAAYGPLLTNEHDSLKQKIDMEKRRIDYHEHWLVFHDTQLLDHEKQLLANKQSLETVKEEVHHLAKGKKLKPKPSRKSVEDKLKKALRDMYSDMRVPVQQSVYGDDCSNATLDDMFVELRLQKSSTSKLPESPGYRDVSELQRNMQSSEPIQMSQLFDKLHDRDVPRHVLILGKAGVGKTTFIKQMARRWAKKKLWKDAVKYMFVITLRQLQQDRMWTLADLLLDGLPLTEAEKTAALKLLQKQASKVMIVEEGMDEINYHDGDGILQCDVNKEADLNTILTRMNHNAFLPGAKVVITSRPNDNIPECDRKAELYGFPQESILKYISKFSRNDTELGNFIRRYLQNNVNIATLCYLPVQCNFVCVCLSDMRLSAHSDDTPTVKTMTQLYVFAMINLARKHGFKNDPSLVHKKMRDSKTFFERAGKSLKCHAELAKHCTMSTPMRIVLYEEDLQRFHITDEDTRIGFLAESETKDLTQCFKRKCWSFNHLSIQELFAAVGLLRGPQEALLDLVEDKASVRQHELLIMFVIGLWCDPQNADFMERQGWVTGQRDPRTFIEKLARVFDTLQLTTVIHESQCPSLVDLVQEEITSKKVFPTEMMALSWVLVQPQCRVTKLNLSHSHLDTELMKQLCNGLTRNTSIEDLNLGYNEILSKMEAVRALSAAVGAMTTLRCLRLVLCCLSDKSLAVLADGLCRRQQLEMLWCAFNPELTDHSRDTFTRLLSQCPRSRILALDCSLSLECRRQLQLDFGRNERGRLRFDWEQLFP